jgi:hypothetical protein
VMTDWSRMRTFTRDASAVRRRSPMNTSTPAARLRHAG